MGNNAIEQLDIISNSDYSVLNLIDKTSTPMGKRLLKSRLLNPIFNPEIINSRYDLVEKTKEFIAHIDNKLKKIYDLERILRRIKLRKLNPMEINYLHISIQATIDIVKIVKRNLIYDVNFTNTELQEIADRIENCFDLNISGKYSLNGIAENIFLRGVNLEIDKIEEQIKNNLNRLNKIVEKIETMLSTRFDKNNKNLVSLGLLEKDGYYISLTRNRFKLIEAEFLNEKIILDSILKNSKKLLELSKSIDYRNSILIISTNRLPTTTKSEIKTILKNIFKWRYAWKYNKLKEYLSFYDKKHFKKENRFGYKYFSFIKKKIFAKQRSKKLKFNNLQVIPYPSVNKDIYKVSFDEYFQSGNKKFIGQKTLYLKLKGDKISIFLEN